MDNEQFGRRVILIIASSILNGQEKLNLIELTYVKMLISQKIHNIFLSEVDANRYFELMKKLCGDNWKWVDEDGNDEYK